VILEKKVSKFYLYIWAWWALRLTLLSITSALVLALAITFYLYVSQGMAPITAQMQEALLAITRFWFLILWNFTLLLFLFRTLKGVFNNCQNNYKLQLLTCPKEGKTEIIDVVGYGDILKVWRKWFMLIIWLVGAQMIIALILSYLFTSYEAIFDWFNIYFLYAFILLAGYFSFIILSVKTVYVLLLVYMIVLISMSS